MRWLDGQDPHFSYAVYELRRSSSLVTPSAVALGESHTPTTPQPRRGRFCRQSFVWVAELAEPRMSEVSLQGSLLTGQSG